MISARMRRRAAAVAVALLAASSWAGVGAATAPAGAAPAITVTPTTDLLAGHPVTVSGTGLPPGASFTIAQCGGSQPDTCATPLLIADGDHSRYPSNLDQVGTDAVGSFSATLIVQRTFTRQSEGVGQVDVDCMVAACTIGVMGDGGDTFVPITFAPTGTYDWPDAHMMAVPTIRVVEHQVVSVQASGLNPRGGPLMQSRIPGQAMVQVCRAVEDPAATDCRGGWDVPLSEIDRLPWFEVRDDGTVHGSFRVTRYLELPGGTIDCAVVGCTVAVTQGDPVSNRVPLSFGPEWAPFRSLSTFLGEVGFVRGRALTADERSALATALVSRTTTGPDAVAAAAEQSLTDPSPAIRRLVDTALLYRAFFGRGADTGGLGYWSGRMEAGLTPLDAARAFGGTAEFRSTYGTSTNAAVVTEAYRNTLGREPDAAGLAYWTGRLDQGLARWKMIYGFGRSAEFVARERTRTAITVLVWRLAGRAPTAAELRGLPPEPEPLGSIRNVAVALLASGDLP